MIGYKHLSFRETLANCLVYADYFLSDCVKVEKYPYQLIFSNPGTIRIGKKRNLVQGVKSSQTCSISLELESKQEVVFLISIIYG